MTTASRVRNGLVILVLIAIVTLLVIWILRPEPAWVQGQIEVTQVRAAAKLPGRVLSIDVEEGQRVEAGQQVALLSSPEIDAKAVQAEAQVAAAQAQADKADSGARDEEVRAAQAQWQAAEAQAQLAEATYVRINNLYTDGVVPVQRRDEARAMARSARAQANAAHQVWQMAQSGTRAEDIRAAEALLAQARGGEAEVQAFKAEEQVLAPAAGEITRKVFEPGEVVPAGAPLVMIARTDEPWLALSLREDLLAAVQLGSALPGRIQALGNRQVNFSVYYIAPMADFATWRSTRDLGGFDLRTFDVRARPSEPVEGLRPGMSVLIDESVFKRAGN